MTRYAKRGLLLAVLGGLLLGRPAAAGEIGDGGPLRKGQEEILFGAGYAFDVDLRGGREDVPFYTFVPGYGRFVNSRIEFLFELPIGVFHTHANAVSVGLNVTMRDHFARFGRYSTFWEVGGGGLWTNLEDGNLGGEGQFIVNAGLGLRYLAGKDQSLTLTGRFHHISNAGLNSPNRGANTFLVLFGYTRFLR